VRPMGRNAAGVRGLKLAGASDEVIALIIIGAGPIMTATANGYGKLTVLEEHPVQGRAAKVSSVFKRPSCNGRVVGALQVSPEDELMLITSAGTLVRTPITDISTMGRNNAGRPIDSPRRERPPRRHLARRSRAGRREFCRIGYGDPQ